MNTTDNYIEPGFLVLQSNKPENLRYLLTMHLKNNPLSPFEDEIIIVHSNGMAQWLQYAFAENDKMGIASSLKMILPSSFIWQIYRAVLGNQGALKIGEKSHFDKSILVWKLYYLFGSKQFKNLNLKFLNDYLNIENFDDTNNNTNNKNKLNYSRYYLAKTLADIYDQYQVYRGDWLLHWKKYNDYFLGSKEQNLLKDEDKWQCDLWHYLTQNINNKNTDSSQWSRADLHPLFLEKINKLTAKNLITNKIKLPKRVSVFGISSLSMQNIDVLYALSKFSQVIICINNPCQYYWADLTNKHYISNYYRRNWKELREKYWNDYNNGKDEDKASFLERNIVSEELDNMLDNSLLTAWGMQGRDTIDYINKVDDLTTYEKIIKDNKVDNIEVFEEPGNDNLLHSIQSHIFNLVLNSDSNFVKQKIAANDKSVSFNIVYSRRREIEILQDNILSELDSNKNLHPREILILAPDIELYSPHIKAVFGTYNKTDKRYIPFSIADQKRKSFSPIMKAVEILLNLDNINITSNEIFTLLDAPALRAKFNINTEDLPQLKRVVNQAQIRWGLSEGHRKKLNKQFQNNNETNRENNTWNSGISRMISGFIFGDISERIGDNNFEYWKNIIPLNSNDISGSKVNNIANLILLCQQLEKWFDELNKPTNISQWRIRLQTLLDDFFDTDSNVNHNNYIDESNNIYAEEILLLKRFYDCLDNWENDNNLAKQALNLIDENLFTTNDSNIENIPLSIVRDYVLSQLDESGLRQPFLGGHLTFATLMPMRSIPYKYIYLIGMNDNEYPRKKPIMDFDLMARYPRFGDRSRREDDRYLFLEAILSAREKLTISYIGFNVRDNNPLEPSVLVSQLQNNILSRFVLDAENNNKNLIENITQIFPLQIFSEKYFNTNSDLLTYAKEWQRNISKNNNENNANINTNKQNFEYLLNKIDTIKLSDLIDFIKSPIEFYFSHYLKIKFPKDEFLNNNLSDIENFDTNHLENYINRNEIINLLTSKQFANNNNNNNISIEKLSEKFLSDGRLPWEKAAELKIEFLNKQLTKLQEEHNKNSLDSTDPKNQELKINIHNKQYKLNGDINNLYIDNQSGKLYRYYISASNLYNDKKLRTYKLLEDFIYHIFANANGLNLTTKILTLNGNKANSEVKNIVLPPNLFYKDECKNLITKYCEFYLQENQPFPIIPEAYFEFLNNQKNDDYKDQYERKKQWNKIAEKTAAIRWTFPNYDEITNNKISDIENNLYQPIFDKLNTLNTNNSKQ